MTVSKTSRRKIALFVNRLTHGGVQHSFLGLAEAFVERGLDVDLVVGDRGQRHDHAMPEGVQVVFLHAGDALSYAVNDLKGWWQAIGCDEWRLRGSLPLRWRSYIAGLTNYLAEREPDAMLSAKTLGNVAALLARRQAGVATRLVISERGHVSESIKRSGKPWKMRKLPALLRRTYPLADGIVAISKEVGDDLAEIAGLERRRVETIYNALLRPAALDLPPADHPWFRDELPVVLGAGRLGKQKDFPTLINAFAKVRARRPCRLMIIGDGEDRDALQRLIDDLDLGGDVLLPGFQANPFAFMKAADLFVLSSTHEGFGNVLVEALAAGCPIVSTACPAGPAEILDGGHFGRLVPVGDADAMAAAIEATLDTPSSPEQLRARAADFSMDRTAERYLACLLPDRLDHPAAA